MKLFRDIKSPWLIHLKAVFFLLSGIVAVTLLIIDHPDLRTITLLLITIWAFCRVYYYLFYVLDRYLGRKKRFFGVFDAIMYIIGKQKE